MSSRTRLKKRETSEAEQEWVVEPHVEIKLSSTSAQPVSQVLYHFQQRQYVSLPKGDNLIHLLTLPSRTILREDLELQSMQTTPQVKDEGATVQLAPQLERQVVPAEEVAQMLEELYGNIMSPEELAKLDSQPNPFNFSDRVSQTSRIPRKETYQQTDQPPSSSFGVTTGLSIVYDAYKRDHNLFLARERQRQLQKEREEEEEKKTGSKVGVCEGARVAG
ncbi:uncharacterized protein [Panulirus ornatus]|uniref:uncharacterized protein n=1 Tax=Panulirus ornatus TaxID=150431 RepID=UPI003A8C1B88